MRTPGGLADEPHHPLHLSMRGIGTLIPRGLMWYHPSHPHRGNNGPVMEIHVQGQILDISLFIAHVGALCIMGLFLSDY